MGQVNPLEVTTRPAASRVSGDAGDAAQLRARKRCADPAGQVDPREQTPEAYLMKVRLNTQRENDCYACVNQVTPNCN